MMSRHFGAAALALGLAWSGVAVAGETLDRVTKTGTLVNVLVNDYPPFSSIDESNHLAGFDVDVAQAVADRLHAKLKLETPGWETIVGGGWHGRFDLCICSMTPSAERAQVLDFPVEYYASPAVLVVNQDDKSIRSVHDIGGKRVGVGTGSSYESYLHKTLQIPGAKPLAFPFDEPQVIPSDETVAFQNLALGPGVRLDAVVADLATTEDRIRSIGKFRIVGEPLYAEPNWVAVDRGDPEWEATVKRVIEELRADGTLAKISQKWLQADVTRAE